jgi:hypothetical protein
MKEQIFSMETGMYVLKRLDELKNELRENHLVVAYQIAESLEDIIEEKMLLLEKQMKDEK